MPDPKSLWKNFKPVAAATGQAGTFATLDHIARRIKSLGDKSDFNPAKLSKEQVLDLALSAETAPIQRAKKVAEKIVAVASRHGASGRVFKGAIHHFAEEAGRASGLEGHFEHGYIASDGKNLRFIDRGEAQTVGRSQRRKNAGSMGWRSEDYPAGTFDPESGEVHIGDAGRRMLTFNRLRKENPSWNIKQLAEGVKKDEATLDLAKKMHADIQGSNGFTYNAKGEPVKQGFAVGAGNEPGNGVLQMHKDEITVDHISDYLRKHPMGDDHLRGGWVDDKGMAFIEPSTHVPDRGAAIDLGRTRGEKAVGDLDAYARGDFDNGTIPVERRALGEDAQRVRDLFDQSTKARAAFDETAAAIRAEPDARRADILASLRPEPTAIPQQRKVPRLVAPKIPTERLDEIEERTHDALLSPEFMRMLKTGNKLKGGPDWYDTRAITEKAKDALGDEEGEQAFSRLMDFMGASTALSKPGNNLRRASWWRGLEKAGLIDPAEAGALTDIAPKGMGHIAQKEHANSVAGLIETGDLDPIAKPKPAGFVENLRMNWMPYTNDTRMAGLKAGVDPKLVDIGALMPKRTKGELTFSPRKWAYAPMERAAQRAAQSLHERGLVDVPDGLSPTAAAQSAWWTGAKPEEHAGSFSDTFDDLLNRTAKLWGKTPGEANRLMWQGNPFDLPLNTPMLRRR